VRTFWTSKSPSVAPADEDVCIFSTFASVLHEILMQVRNVTKLRRYYDAIALYQDLDQVDQECLD
jgi:hypothetical protein